MSNTASTAHPASPPGSDTPPDTPPANRSGARPATAKASETQAKLIAAGIECFSSQGYDATGTREVEARAGVQRNLINYHFGSKDEFWKRCMAALFGRAESTMGQVVGQARDIEPTERIRFLIRHYLRNSAANPEIMRVMLDEGRRDDWRLAWLVEHHVRRFYDIVQGIFNDGRDHGVVPDLSVVQFYYVLVSSASIFAMAPECRLLSGVDPTDPALIDAHADAIARLLTTPSPTPGGRP